MTGQNRHTTVRKHRTNRFTNGRPKMRMLRRNDPVVYSVESVLRLEGSIWWERFVKEIGLEPGVKARGSYGW